MAIKYPMTNEIQDFINTANEGDIIYLPIETIKFQIVITTNCMVYGRGSGVNKTRIDVSEVDQSLLTNKCALLIQNTTCSISNIDCINKKESEHYGIIVDSSNVDINETTSTGISGIKFINCITSNIDESSFSDSEIGMEFSNSYGITIYNTEIYKGTTGIIFTGSSSEIGDTTEIESLRTDRCHDVLFQNVNIFSVQNAVQLINSNNITFEDCKIYDCSGIGILQTTNSYNNKFRGEIFNVNSYGIKNSDPQAGVHIFDAMEVWWGDSTGPSGMGKGRGVKISKNVTYDSWLRTGTEPELTFPGTRRWIWNMLGYPQVKVELTEEDVSDSINMAIDKYLYYMTPDLDYYYFNASSGIHEYKLPSFIPKSSITEVVYQPNSDIFADLSGSGESFFLTYYMQGSNGTFLSDFYVAMSYKETLERTLGINPTYEFLSRINNEGVAEEFIRIYPRPSTGIKIGIKYNRLISEAETDATTWVRKYALSWAKEKLGRVRSKYSSVPGPTGEMTLDGNTLLGEYATEREALVTEIIGLGEPLSFSCG